MGDDIGTPQWHVKTGSRCKKQEIRLVNIIVTDL